MNAIHRLVWNDVHRAWVPTLLCAALAAAGPVLAQPAPHALPGGGQVTAGQASIGQNGAQMTIQQGSDRAAIDWQQFNVGRDASVRFQQPSAQSVTLNRVQGPDASQIFGRITANGQVFLSNPNGVYFAPGASVDVGGLVATTHRISLDDFMAGRTRFERQGATGSVVNEGELRAALGGYIALLAPEVRNQGIVVANLGTVALAAGEAFELQFDAFHTLAGLRVEGSTLRALVDNRSAVLAPGGLVILSAQALDRVQGGVVRNSGRIEATGLAQRGGRIVLEASSQVANSGSISASASATAEGPAGSVRLQAPEVVNSGSITATGSAAHPQGGRIEIVADTVRQTATGSIDASGPSQGGTVHIRAAAQVELAGRVAAQATLDLPTPQPTPAPAPAATAPAPAAAPAPAEVPAQGGSITIEAAQITLPSASLDASGGRGGSIVLDTSVPAPTLPWSPPAPAPEPGKVALLGTTQLSTRGRRGGGGSLTLLGDDLHLKDHTALDASGSTGGGTVLVGGGWQGTGGWYQATTVTIEAGARIDASATQQGHGGTVVLWSDVHRSDSLTTAAGSIRARGGPQGGNGGRIETSGHAVALEGLAVDAGAAPGQGGTGGLWLIDPTDSVINQTIANGYAATLNTGTSVLNEVIGTITWNSGVTLATTAGGVGARATLTLRSGHPSTSSAITLTNASITATGGALDLVLWTSYNTPGFAGPVRITGSTINTNGGHVWVGGGNAAGALWNGLAVGEGPARTWTANEQGVYLNDTSISTGAGSIQISGQSFVTAGDLAGTSNMGVWLDTGTTLTTTSGAIEVQGLLQGSYATATGLRVGGHTGSNAGHVRIETGSGNLTLTGTLQGTPASWGHGLFLDGNFTAGNQITVRSGAGAIVLNGSATPTGGSGDVSGLQIHGGSSGGFTHVVSTSGGITLRGSHSNTSAWYSNGIRLTAQNIANSIRIGDDGSGSYSGNIVVESDSLFQRSNLAGSGAIAVQTTGALAIQSAGASFSGLRAGDDGGNIALTFDNDWNFGTTLSSFTLGKSTNTLDLTLSNALSVAGGINLYGGQLALNAALTSTGTGNINLIGHAATNAGIVANGSGTISKTGGGNSTLTVRSNGRVNLGGAITNTSTSGVLHTVLWSDYGNTTTFGVSSVPSITTRGGHLWVGGSSSANGSAVWNGLTVGDGPAVGGASGNNNAIDMRGALNTSNGAAGGDVYLWGGTPHTGALSIGSDASFTGITSGSGNITVRGNTFSWPNPVNIDTTGAFTLWSGTGTISTDTGSFGQGTDFSYFKFNASPSAFTWGGVNNTQAVTYTPSENASLSVAGPITVYGGNINLNASLGSTLAGAGISLRASGSITTSNAITLSTNGGALLLAADTDNAGGGIIHALGNFTATTSGGAITLGGGSDGSGYATGFAADGTNANGIRLRGTSTLHSGGGNISLRGKSHTNGGNANNAAAGLWFDGSSSIDSGTGTVVLEGVSQASAVTNDYTLGMMFSFVGGATTSITSANTTANAIRLVGNAATAGNSAFSSGFRFYNNGTSITATGLGGGITLEGTRNTAGNPNDFSFANSSGTGTTSNILANGGAINLNGKTIGGRIFLGNMTLGSKAGTAVTSSSSNVTLTADEVSGVLAGSAINTSGTLTVQPFGNNFSSPLNWPLSNLTLSSNVSGLTLGKDVPGVAKTDTININAPQTIAGPIAVYGGAVNVNAALTAAGDITLVSSGTDADLLINVPITSNAAGTSSLLLKSARNVSLAAGGSISAAGGPLNTQFWADSDRTGDGINRLLSNIDTNGGWLKFGNDEFATINGVSTRVGGDLFINGSGAQTIATGGGQFDLFGEAILANTAGLTISTAGGNVNFFGVLNSGNTYTYVDKTGSAGSGSWTGARTEARNGTAGGAAVGDSYLATITSRLENSLASLAADYRGAWMGAWRAAPTGSYAWSWADGPEAGQNFFNQTTNGSSGSAVSGRFHNFDPVEPNGTLSGNESVAQFYGNSGRWNDLSPNTTYSATQASQVSVLGFVRETNLASSPLTINAGSGAVTIHGAVGGSKALASLNVQAASTTVNGGTLLTSGAQSYSNALSVVSSGDLTVGATTLTVGNANQAALFKAAGNLTLNAGLALTTNNGHLTLWSNASNLGTAGAITLGDSTTLNTANGATSQSSGGGRIVMAGGLDDGSNGGTAGDGVPDGFASSSTSSGIFIGTAGTAGTTRLYSGGGDILLRGNATGGGNMGIQWNKGGTIEAGNGTVRMTGTASQGHGMELGAFSGSTHITAGGGDATQPAIQLVGTSASTSSLGIQTNSGALQATGAGGITVTGTTAAGSSGQAVNLGLDALAASGPIAISANGGTGLRYGGTLGKKAGTGVTASSSHITLTGNALAVNTGISVDTTGTLTVQPFGSSFTSPLAWPIANFSVAPTLSGLTLGKQGNTADITVSAAQSIGGPIRIYGGNVALNGDLTTTQAGAAILVKASGNIVSNTGRTFQTNNGDISFWSDSDASGAGNIIVGSGNTLNAANGATGQATGGGRITLAGGLDDGGSTVASGRTAGDERPDGYAVAANTANSLDTGAGVSIGAGSNLHSGGGDVFVAGQGASSTAGGVQTSGIWFWSGLVDSGAGKLALHGRNVATNNANNANSFGIHLNTGSGDNTSTTLVSASTAADAITLVGDSSASTTTGSSGLLAFFSNTGNTVGTRIAATGGGGITLTGKGSTGPNATGTGVLGDGIDLNFAQVLSTGGPITLSGTGGPYGLSLGGRSRTGNFVTLGRAAGVTVNGQSMAASSSNVVLNADAWRVNAGGSSGWLGSIGSTGALTVQPLGANFASALSWPQGLSVGGDLSGLTLGKAGNTADITIASAVAVNGPVSLYGGNLTLDAGLTASGSTVTLAASGTVDDGASGFVAAANLRLLGGNVTLDNAGNTIGTLAASGVGSLVLHNSGALRIGTVDGSTGVAASGTVAVSTENGDLTLAGAVVTLDAGSCAIVLNAARARAAGTPTGGNIVVSGSPTVSTGAGGRATLYSGEVAGSTGLAALVGSGRARYGSDESASNFSAALGSGLYAVYREVPTVALAWNHQSVVYGTAPGAFSYTVTGGTLHSGDAPAAAISGGVLSGAGHLAVASGPYAVVDSGALAALGYNATVAPGSVTVTPRALTSSYTGTTRAYDGTTAVGAVGASDDRLTGDVLSVGGAGQFADANVGIAKSFTVVSASLSGADAANYSLVGGGSGSGDVTPRTVSATGAVVANKVYDGTTDATVLQPGQALTGVGSETLNLSATGADFATADAGSGKTVTVSGYALANGANGGLASNYQLASTTATTTADIAKAVLKVVANDDAKFITRPDAPGYNGVATTGFVHGETAAVLGGAASITRSNAGTEGPGIYSGVLVPDTSGLSAANYSFQAVAGSYTIVPSNQLLVRLPNTVGTYGAAPAHSIASAQYFDGVSVVDLTGITALGGNRFTVSDGVGGSATFTVSPTGAPVSTGGWTGVGAWQLRGSDISTLNAANFSNTVTVVGSQTVGARGLAVSAAGGLSKVYDGTTAMPSVTLQLGGAAAGDVLGVGAQGSFASRNAGSNIAYAVNGIALSGADAANYYLSSGSSFAGSNGSITPRPLNVSYSGVHKVYDGSTAASVTTSDDRIAGDVFSVSATAAFADKNVGTGKAVAVSGALLSGGDAGNYSLASTSGSTTADITRLASVTWTGGATGNWFDPANWAGGAVPDLANVAGVVIPAGVVVSFDTAGAVAPAQTGPVQVDSLGGQGGSLVQNDGALDVGGGGITLGGLTQNGGSLASDGSIVVNDFTQTGGSTRTQGDLTVNGNFAQGPNGTVAVQGDARILDTNGGTTIGNLQAGGDLAITSTDGGIAQAPGTAIVVNGTTTLDAGASAITLDGAGNDFQGPFNASGGDITVVDGTGGLVIGNIDAAGNFDASSTGGDITQAPGTVIVVDGTTTVDAGSNDIRLDGPDNDFQGPFNASGGDIAVVDGTGGLVMGNIDAAGNFDATSTGGDITQAPGAVIVVDGTTTVDAGTSDIRLDGPGNDFQGPFNASGGAITVVDGTGGLVIGNIDAAGNFDSTSTGGDITQQPGSSILVTGATTVDAGTDDIRLDGPGNDFVGRVNASGANITLVDGRGGLVLGDVTASGRLEASSRGGDLTQAAGTRLDVVGAAVLAAPDGAVQLSASNNRFGGPLTVDAGVVPAAAQDAAMLAPPPPPVLVVPVLESAPPLLSESPRFDAPITVAAPRAAASTGFSFALPLQLVGSVPPGTPILVTLEDGSPLPAWLRFDEALRTLFATAVPAGGLPLTVAVRVGGKRTLVRVAALE